MTQSPRTQFVELFTAFMNTDREMFEKVTIEIDEQDHGLDVLFESVSCLGGLLENIAEAADADPRLIWQKVALSLNEQGYLNNDES